MKTLQLCRKSHSFGSSIAATTNILYPTSGGYRLVQPATTKRPSGGSHRVLPIIIAQIVNWNRNCMGTLTWYKTSYTVSKQLQKNSKIGHWAKLYYCIACSTDHINAETNAVYIWSMVHEDGKNLHENRMEKKCFDYIQAFVSEILLRFKATNRR